MTPLSVTALLMTPPVSSVPIMLDGLLYYGMGAMVGEQTEGRGDPAEIEAVGLPLARITGDAGEWWYAASQHTLTGPESRVYFHRRAALELAREFGDFASMNVASGDDKSLRVPIYFRPGQLRLDFTCIGDRVAVASLLSRVPFVGKYSAWGWGQVGRWEINEVDGPGEIAYRTDPQIRHLPCRSGWYAEGVRKWTAPLRPPYWDRSVAVPVWQSVETRR